MKKGCSFWLIFIFVILFASLYYIFNSHNNDLVQPIGSKIKTALYENILRQLEVKLTQSMSDSLKTEINTLKINLKKNFNKMNYSSLKKIQKELKKIIKQNIPDLNKLSKLEKKIEQYGK